MNIHQQVFYDDKNYFSRMFFNVWEWNTKQYSQQESQVNQALSDITFEINRKSLLAQINSRTRCELVILYTRRLISLIINSVVLIGGMYLIIKAQDENA